MLYFPIVFLIIIFFRCVFIPGLLCSTWFLIWFLSSSSHECWLWTPLLNNRIYKAIYIVITTWSLFPGCYLWPETMMLEKNEQRRWVRMAFKRNWEDCHRVAICSGPKGKAYWKMCSCKRWVSECKVCIPDSPVTLFFHQHILDCFFALVLLSLLSPLTKWKKIFIFSVLLALGLCSCSQWYFQYADNMWDLGVCIPNIFLPIWRLTKLPLSTISFKQHWLSQKDLLEAFKAELNGALGGQMWWVTTLTKTGELELDDL